jgi:outer membrane protein TolC
VRRLILALLCLPHLSEAAEPFELQLAKAEAAALEASNLIHAARSELRAADEKGDQGFSLLWPRLSLDASDRYSTVVPELSLAPNQPKKKFGDHNVYSVGVGALWTIWDSGNAYNLYRGAAALREGKQAELEARQREIRLRARLSYFQTQLMAERARLLADSLKLSQSQAKDIELRLKAGASSRIDALASQNDVLVRRGQYRAARADLALALRDLFALTGLGAEMDPSVPEAAGLDSAPADTEAATLTLRAQSLESSLAELSPAENAPLNPELPQTRALKAAATAARRQGDAYQSGHWPRIQVSARSSYDYPNGPVLETIQQNSFAVSGTWPIFSFGQVSSQAAEQEALASAAESRALAVSADLRRDWLKSKDRLKALKDQKVLDEQSVAATGSLYKLVYSAYQNGSSSFLEVQSAELKAFESKVRLASTETQMLIELAMLSSLSE